MSKSECANANWQARGYSDGQNGSPRSLLSRHIKACGKIGVYPNQAQYQSGYLEGVKLYCTPRNGLKEGRLNAEYHDVCPVELESAFLKSHIDGLQLKLTELEQEKFSANSELFTLRLLLLHATLADKKGIRHDINNLESSLSRITSNQLAIQTRISEYRLQIQSNSL